MKYSLIIFLILLPSICRSQGSYYTINPISDEYALDEIPVNVVLNEGKLQLYTDFNDIDSVYGLISVYLINNTDSSYRFSNNSISDFVLPEYKTIDNHWIRYIPFYYGWCGTPYVGGFEIDPQKYIKLTVLYPMKGEKKVVRYKLHDYLSFASNEGPGFVDSTIDKKVIYDDISFQFGDISFLTSIAYGYLPSHLTDVKIRVLRKKAIKYITFYYSDDIKWEILYDLYKTDDEYGRYTKKMLTSQ